VVDLDASLFGVKASPAGVRADPDGAVHGSLLMVLVKEGGAWWISAYHNVWRQVGGELPGGEFAAGSRAVTDRCVVLECGRGRGERAG
jgi:hypothetical protein